MCYETTCTILADVGIACDPARIGCLNCTHKFTWADLCGEGCGESLVPERAALEGPHQRGLVAAEVTRLIDAHLQSTVEPFGNGGCALRSELVTVPGLALGLV